MFRLLVMTERRERLLDQLLQVGLPGVDDIAHPRRAPEDGGSGSAAAGSDVVDHSGSGSLSKIR